MMNTTQKFHLQDVYWVMKPLTIGPRTGPQKLANVKRAKGTERCDGGHKSTMDPPELVTADKPNKPAMKRKIRKADISGDSAHPRFARQKSRKDE